MLDAVRGESILKAIEKFKLLENVSKNSEILKNELIDLVDNYRSVGHLIAFDFKTAKERDIFVHKAYDNYLLINPTSEKSVRLRPNLAISENEVGEFVERFKTLVA